MENAMWDRLAQKLQPDPAEAKFEEWLRRVDAAVQRRCGLSYQDLADQPYRDWFEDGVPPSRAAARAIKYEGG